MAIDPYGRLAFGHLLQLHKELVLPSIATISPSVILLIDRTQLRKDS